MEEEIKKYDRPKLKTPPPPEIAYLDLDGPLFAGASAGEQVVYSAVTPEGKVIGSFKKAKEYKSWLEECEIFEADVRFGYDGDLSEITRQTSYEIGDFEDCVKAFDSIVAGWVKQSGCKEYVGYVAKASGEENFRYAVATKKPYKGNRKGLRKPHYLEQLRKYVTGYDYIKVPRGPYEVDDLVCAKAQVKGWKGCVVSVDKDSVAVINTHMLIPDEMTKPKFSSRKVVGRLFKHKDTGKIVGRGTLFWLYQTLHGDSADNYGGCEGVGEKGAYEALKEFDGVSSSHLRDAVKRVAEFYHKRYGEEHQYPHHTTGEIITASGAELFVEMSHLAYMKKSMKDECFWIPIIYEVWEEILEEVNHE